jgi:hypothetical protein
MNFAKKTIMLKVGRYGLQSLLEDFVTLFICWRCCVVSFCFCYAYVGFLFEKKFKKVVAFKKQKYYNNHKMGKHMDRSAEGFGRVFQDCRD